MIYFLSGEQTMTEGYAGRLNTPKTLQRLQLTKLRVGHALNSAGIALQLVF